MKIDIRKSFSTAAHIARRTGVAVTGFAVGSAAAVAAAGQSNLLYRAFAGDLTAGVILGIGAVATGTGFAIGALQGTRPQNANYAQPAVQGLKS